MATIHDVARHAGVSVSAVSRYVNNRISLPAGTAARIDAAIARLDYRPNLMARRLSTGRSEAISLVTPEIANPFFAELAAAVEAEAARNGYSVFLSSTQGIREREITALHYLKDRHVDGMILMTNRPDDGSLGRLIKANARNNVVLLDEDVPGAEAPRVFVENDEGAYLATRHLIEAGHRDIAHIGGPEGLMSVRERRAGFERAVREANLTVPEPNMIFGEYSRGFGRLAARMLMQSRPRPTAVFAASDYIALGTMQEFGEFGLKVPQDISLVGFDDMPFADLVSPPLTTVRQPIDELGRLAFQRLLALMNDQDAPPLTRLPVSLVTRGSVAPPAQKDPP